MPFLSINGSTVFGWLWQVNGNTPLSATVTLNAWHLLTITYDPSAQRRPEKFYVDGALSLVGDGHLRSARARDRLPDHAESRARSRRRRQQLLNGHHRRAARLQPRALRG